MDNKKQQPPPWYNKKQLRHVNYAEAYSGWIIDLGDGTGRYVNEPLLGDDDGDDEKNRRRPHWGDRVKLDANGNPIADQIVERWQPERYDEKGDWIPWFAKDWETQ